MYFSLKACAILAVYFQGFLLIHLAPMVSALNDVITFPLMNEQSIHHRTLLEGKHNSVRSGLKTITEDSSTLLPVFQDYGAYYIDIYVGSPPQRQTVMLDTGSENLAIPCTGCDECGDTHTDKYFRQSDSTSFQTMNCSECFDGRCVEGENICLVETSYVEGSSWKGNEVKDNVHVGDEKDTANVKFPLKFTCMASNEGEFKKQKADGIMGLNLKKASFWRQMHENGVLKSNQFSMCMRKFPYVPLEPQVQHVGAMTFGGVDSRLHSTPMSYMKLERDISRQLFSVQIRKLSLVPSVKSRLGRSHSDLDLSYGDQIIITDDENILNKQQVIVDSGTTDTILPKELKPLLDQAFMRVMGRPFPDQSVKISGDELRTWPSIILQMKGSAKENPNPLQVHDKDHPNDMSVVFPPSSYMRLDISTGNYQPAISMHNDFDVSILGSNFMRGHNVLFDVDNLRIGMAESTCDYQLVTTGIIDDVLADPYISYLKIINSYQEGYYRSKCQDNKVYCWLFWVLNKLPIYLMICIVAASLHEYMIRSKSFPSRVEGLTVKLSRSDSEEEDWKHTKLRMKSSEENNYS